MLFEYTKEGEYPPSIQNLAEAFGMMMVQVEAREYNLEGLIEDLEAKNKELETALKRVQMLESVKSHMSKFVPSTVIRAVEANPDAPDLDKKDRDVTVLFLDIAGYTKMSEKVDPSKVNYLIETYFSRFLDIIVQHRGDINETAGDGLMIIFQGDDPKEHVRNAMDAAVGIQRATREINESLAGDYDPVAVNIGINSGTASVGSTRFTGAAGDRFTFTASGSMTNIAARIGAQATNGTTYVGPETHDRAGSEFQFREVGELTLKNVGHKVPVFEVLSD